MQEPTTGRLLDHDQLRALAAVLRTGAFDQAAHALGVTPSAISQRIKGLEERVGTVLVRRGTPCTGTAIGRRLAAHAEEILRRDLALAAEIGLGAGPQVATLRVAVNADSLATWFIDALAQVEGFSFELVVDDQEFSADLLRRGEVAAAVTGRAKPVQGCDIWPLGAIRYVPTASPAFAARWFAKGPTEPALAQAPCLTFNSKDRLQDHWIQRRTGRRLAPPRQWIPSAEAYLRATEAGLGWGLNPETLVAPALAAGRLVELPGGRLDVALYWQVLRLMAPLADPLTRAVRSVAGAQLAAAG